MASRQAYFIGFIVVLVLLHFTLHLGIGAGGSAPDLIIVAALLAARRMSAGKAAVLGFGLGLLADSLSLTAFGANTLGLTVLCYGGARSRDLFEGESVLFAAVYVFLGKWLRDTLVFLFTPDSARGEALSTLLVALPLAALYAAVSAVAALLLYRALSGERN
jgi:rod shape-determining protein MreD